MDIAAQTDVHLHINIRLHILAADQTGDKNTQ